MFMNFKDRRPETNTQTRRVHGENCFWHLPVGGDQEYGPALAWAHWILSCTAVYGYTIDV